jgi:DNA replication licensing factor MCM5
MSGFDQHQVFTSVARDPEGEEEHDNLDAEAIDLQATKKSFKEFIRQYQEGSFNYKYR